jgi:hypothetical protein
VQAARSNHEFLLAKPAVPFIETLGDRRIVPHSQSGRTLESHAIKKEAGSVEMKMIKHNLRIEIELSIDV